MRRAFSCCVLLVVAGCAPDAGPCDSAAAGRIVYLRSRSASSPSYGIPMYEGQALVTASCGDGSYCHSNAARGQQRFGVPLGFDFDLPVGCTDGPCAGNDFEHGIALANVARVLDHAGTIRSMLDHHLMPPRGIGAQVVAKSSTFVHASSASGFDLEASGIEKLKTPFEDRDGTFEIVRNWIACGAPIVEATRAPLPATEPGASCDSMPADFPACVQRVAVAPLVPEPTFDAIHAAVLGPLCGATCHGGGAPNDLGRSQLDLSTSTRAYAALVGASAGGSSCGGTGLVRVVAGNPEDSLLVQKLEGRAACGDSMPARSAYGRLPPSVIAPIRAWISAGALR